MAECLDRCEVRSELDAMRGTWTPVFVMNLARGICEGVRANLGSGRFNAQLLPDHGKTLMVHVQNESNCTYMVCVNFDRPYRKGSASSGVLPLDSIDAPDFPEALHLIGIVLDSLHANITDIGKRDLEQNPDILRTPLRGGRKSDHMDRCLRHAVRLSRPLPNEGFDRFKVDAEGNDTPVEIFNWVVNAARRVRGILSGRLEQREGWIKAGLWGYRGKGRQSRFPASGTVEPLSGTLEAPSPRFVVRFSGENGRHHDIVFALVLRSDTDPDCVVVPCFMLALHMAGMLIDALNAKVTAVGNRHWEKNEEVLARPLERMIEGTPVFNVGMRGRITNALNFVMPFETVEL